jgi:hypothetical protein
MATITSTTTVKHEFRWGAVIQTRRTTESGHVVTSYEICEGSDSISLTEEEANDLKESLMSFLGRSE